jgi:ion channel-forming bestrophin family protein
MRKREELVYDEEKEISRTFRRTVFDFDYWANHRSTSRYLFHMITLLNSRIIRSLGAPIAWIMTIATLICAEHTLAQNGIIPAQYEFGNLDLAPVSLTSFALSLLLVFRTNSSYGRFDEARKMWGLMLNRSRDIARQAVSYFPDRDVMGNYNQHTKATFARWTAVFTIALKCHLRPNEDLRGEASQLLSADELELLMSAEHKVRSARLSSSQATFACACISEILR